MKCEFCGKPVYGHDGVTVKGGGPAHIKCLEIHTTMKREFMGLDITELTDKQLADLKDLVLSEENARKPKTQDDEVELF